MTHSRGGLRGRYILFLLGPVIACAAPYSLAPLEEDPADPSTLDASAIPPTLPQGDASTDLDASLDANAEAGSPLCAGSHWFCDDFEGTTFVPPWSSSTLENGGTTTHASVALGGLGSFLASAPAGPPTAPSGSVSGRLVKFGAAGNGATGLTCAFGYRPKTVAPSVSVLAEMYFTQTGKPDARLWLAAEPDNGRTRLEEGLASQVYAYPPEFTVGAYTKVRLTMKFGSGVSLLMNGVEYASGQNWQATSRAGAITSAKVTLGMYRGTRQIGDWEGYFDDVVCDLVP